MRKQHDLVITNVPGPQVPLYAAGERMVASYPVLPLRAGHRLAIGVTSYNGEVFFGLTADRDAISDLDVLAQCMLDAVEELLDTTVRAPAAPAAHPQGLRGGEEGRRPEGRRAAGSERRTAGQRRAAMRNLAPGPSSWAIAARTCRRTWCARRRCRRRPKSATGGTTAVRCRGSREGRPWPKKHVGRARSRPRSGARPPDEAAATKPRPSRPDDRLVFLPVSRSRAADLRAGHGDRAVGRVHRDAGSWPRSGAEPSRGGRVRRTQPRRGRRAGRPDSDTLRLVLAADVADSSHVDGRGRPGSAMVEALSWSPVQALFADEPQRRERGRRGADRGGRAWTAEALATPEVADLLDAHDLLWFAPRSSTTALTEGGGCTGRASAASGRLGPCHARSGRVRSPSVW